VRPRGLTGATGAARGRRWRPDKGHASKGRIAVDELLKLAIDVVDVTFQ
jgi:hypothetical protein